jgi:DNA-nicking Smr family endonuclease
VKKKVDITISDKKLWSEYLKNPNDIFDKELDTSKDNARPKRFRFDLHGFTLLEANEKIEQLINYCQQKGFKEILLITGKGLHSNTEQNTYVSKELSKLKFAVPDYIQSKKNLSGKIVSIKQADIEDGGEGALIIKLKKL